MRYPAEQKAETHEKIVETAAREFRAKGLQGIGIADLMSELGLTHGGFYAHFRDKDALVAEASQRAAADSLALLTSAAESAPPGKAVEAILDRYLQTAHRDNPGRGCVLPALASEISRQPDSVRTAFTEALKRNIGVLAGYMPGAGTKTRTAQAMILISVMAGAMLLARGMNDSALSEALLASVRTQCAKMFRASGLDTWP